MALNVWTQNLSRAHRVAEQIRTGTVWVNCWLVRGLRVPFGRMKQSGVGREGGDEALRFFHRTKECLHRKVTAAMDHGKLLLLFVATLLLGVAPISAFQFPIPRDRQTIATG